MDADAMDTAGQPVLEVQGLVKHFTIGSGLSFWKPPATVRAVDDVSFTLMRGETLGIVGESGCGKSTLARTLLRLEEPTAGTARFRDRDVMTLDDRELKDVRRRLQVVFQDPYASLNPHKRVVEIVSEPWRIHPDFLASSKWRERVCDLLESVGLRREHADRFPHEFSGGQRQRIGIARAMALEPDVVICDEPVSALDVSVQAQVINLLEDIQKSRGVSYIFIAHDLSVVRHLAHRVAVMYLGQIVEIGAQADVYDRPRHPYTRALISAEPVVDFSGARRSKRIVLKGEIPSPTNPPAGCRFRNRCWKAQDICKTAPKLKPGSAPGHMAACHFPDNADV